jgi:hypothetical protein
VGVSRVEFYANGSLLSASNVAPYSYSWNTAGVSNGSYALSARAYDSAGNVSNSSSVSVVVNNSSSLNVKGDINIDGKTDIADALLALRMAVGLVTPTTDTMLRGDVAPVNAIDGKITIQDVMTILSAASGRIAL